MLHRTLIRTLAAGFVLASAASAGTLYVDVNRTTGANDGSSWADAFQGVGGLQSALAAAVSGDQIWVASGVYKPTLTTTRTIYFQLANGVEIYGGFNGSESVLAQRDFALNVTTLSGDLLGNDGSNAFGDNSFHVLQGAGTNATAVIDGFVVTGGNANSATNNQDKGGGILCLAGASPTVRNCLFTLNRCTFGGGAGYINSSSPSFSDCVFDGNIGGSFGGAFDMASGVGATFNRCVFRNNTAARAGAIEIFGSSPVKVWNCLFHNNTSTGTGGGGAIFVSSSTPQIRNCTIVFNSATANATGGILGAGGTVINCVVFSNTGSGGSSGAAAQLSPSNMNVTYSLTSTGFAGIGNITATPLFDTCGPQPYRLTTSSPGIDAGSNAGVPAGAMLDLAGAPRMGDSVLVVDSGSGTGAIVDMGAFESSDCNGNSVADWCDLQAGTSLDVNANGLPDDCECQGGTPPVVYCTAKINSQFCLPAISATGFASLSIPAPFSIEAVNIVNQKQGLLFYGYGAGSTPFLGGFLCTTTPLRRTPAQNSGGSLAGADCSGSFAFDFNAWLASGADPLLVVGQQVNAQFWSRDPQDPFTTNLTDAVQFSICQ
jgi:hypothetical protein